MYLYSSKLPGFNSITYARIFALTFTDLFGNIIEIDMLKIDKNLCDQSELLFKAGKKANIWNRYNQVPHLTQD